MSLGYPMRIKLNFLLVQFAGYYITRGAFKKLSKACI